MNKLDTETLLAIRQRAITVTLPPSTAADSETDPAPRDRYNLLNHIAWQEGRIESLENALHAAADDAELTTNFCRVAAKDSP